MTVAIADERIKRLNTRIPPVKCGISFSFSA